jgi:hypothetical protein
MSNITSDFKHSLNSHGTITTCILACVAWCRDIERKSMEYMIICFSIRLELSMAQSVTIWDANECSLHVSSPNNNSQTTTRQWHMPPATFRQRQAVRCITPAIHMATDCTPPAGERIPGCNSHTHSLPLSNDWVARYSTGSSLIYRLTRISPHEHRRL